jgi:nucleotide-binding universal stress UspA family protein
MNADSLITQAHPMTSSAEQPAPRIVVVGYDGSRSSQRALARAAEAAHDGGHVVVVTAVPAASERAFEGVASSSDGPAQLVEHAAALLEGVGVQVSTRVEEAEPAEALAATARSLNASLIVVGAQGDSYLTRALRGSVGERLITRAPCDLLVVR